MRMRDIFRWLACFAGLLLNAIGLAGVPDDLAAWMGWIGVLLDESNARWAFLVAGMAILGWPRIQWFGGMLENWLIRVVRNLGLSQPVHTSPSARLLHHYAANSPVPDSAEWNSWLGGAGAQLRVLFDGNKARQFRETVSLYSSPGEKREVAIQFLMSAATEIESRESKKSAKTKGRTATPLTVMESGGSAKISLSSGANGGMWQSESIDFGDSRSDVYRVDTNYMFMFRPESGAKIHHYGSWSDSPGPGRGNTSGVSSQYCGYSLNEDESVGQLEFLGSHVCTFDCAPATQYGGGFVIRANGRYLNLVVHNAAGVPFSEREDGRVITITPIR